MTNEPETLEPCPFCGGEAELANYANVVKCTQCGAHGRDYSDRTYSSVLRDDRAINAWNVRYKRTCKPVGKFNNDSPWPVMVCSECGRPLHYDETNDDYEYAPYCCCGAEVVDGY